MTKRKDLEKEIEDELSSIDLIPEEDKESDLYESEISNPELLEENILHQFKFRGYLIKLKKTDIYKFCIIWGIIFISFYVFDTVFKIFFR